AGNFPPGLAVVVHAPEIVPARHGRKGAIKRQDLKAVARQIEVANDLRPEKRNHVGTDRKLETGKDFFRHSGAAHHVTSLTDKHFLPSARKISSVVQAIMPAADHDYIVFGF